jgi:hypothetical protein
MEIPPDHLANLLARAPEQSKARVAERIARIARGSFWLTHLTHSGQLGDRARESRRVRPPVSGKNRLLPVRKGLHTAASLRSHFREAGLPDRTTPRGVAKWQTRPLNGLFFRVYSRFPLCQPAPGFGKVANRVGADSSDRHEERCDAGFPRIGNGEPMKIGDVCITG